MTLFARIVVGVDGTDWGFEALRQALVLAPKENPVVHAVTALDTAPAIHTRVSGRAFRRSYWRTRPKRPVTRPKRSSAAGRVSARASCAGSRSTFSGVNATSCRPRSWRSAADGAAAFSESCSATPEQSSCTTRPVPPCSPARPTTARGGRARSSSGLTARPTPSPRCGRPKSSRTPTAARSR